MHTSGSLAVLRDCQHVMQFELCAVARGVCCVHQLPLRLDKCCAKPTQPSLLVQHSKPTSDNTFYIIMSATTLLRQTHHPWIQATRSSSAMTPALSGSNCTCDSASCSSLKLMPRLRNSCPSWLLAMCPGAALATGCAATLPNSERTCASDKWGGSGGWVCAFELCELARRGGFPRLSAACNCSYACISAALTICRPPTVVVQVHDEMQQRHVRNFRACSQTLTCPNRAAMATC